MKQQTVSISTKRHLYCNAQVCGNIPSEPFRRKASKQFVSYDSYDLQVKRACASQQEVRSELVAIAFLLAFALCGLNANLLIVLFQRSEIFASFAELTFFHALTNIPMDEGALAVHKIELVINAGEHFGDGRTVTDHTASTHDLRQIAAGNHCGRLVVDAALEACGAPVDELDGALGLNRCDRSIHILGHDVTTIHHAASHVFAVTRIALHKHRGWLEHGHCDLCHRELFMVG